MKRSASEPGLTRLVHVTHATWFNSKHSFLKVVVIAKTAKYFFTTSERNWIGKPIVNADFA